MRICDSIIKSYLAERPCSEYADHWVYHEAVRGKYSFNEPSADRVAEVEDCYNRAAELCGAFRFRNHKLVEHIFGGISGALQHADVLFTVGLPEWYDALVLVHDGLGYVVIDLINVSDHIKNGHDPAELMHNFLTHELIHVLINERYPQENFTYTEYLEFIAFHEGFAHMLSHAENIEQFHPDDTYRERFLTAKARLAAALSEKDPALQTNYSYEANSGRYWDKFASISSMLYLMKHIGSLKEIFDAGWRGYAERITAYSWE